MKIKGHIISEHSFSGKNGIEIQYYCRGEKENFEIRITNEDCVFFVEKDSKLLASAKKSKELALKTPGGQGVFGIYSRTFSELEELKKKAQELGVRTYEIDVRPQERYLMERFIFREFEFEAEEFSKIFYNPILKPSGEKINDFTFLSFDIETGVSGDLYSISFDYGDLNLIKRDSLVMMIGDQKESTNEVHFFASEKELLMSFEDKFKSIDPDFIFGWNVIGFDFTFLVDKAKKLGLELKLGRDQSAVELNGNFIQIKGRMVIDGPSTLRNNFYSFDNYKLDTVANEVLGHGKDISSDENKVGEIERRFREDKLALAHYNLLDSKLVTDIFTKLKVMPLLLERSRLSGMPLDKLHFSSAAFDFIYLPLFHRRGYVASNISDIELNYEGSGGLVITPASHRFDNVVVLDFKSLYPSIMRSFNIDPWALIEGENSGEKIPSGETFSLLESPLSFKIKELLGKREIAKAKGDKELSQAIKILMNSFFGILGSTRSRFYNASLPKAITETGQFILKLTQEYIEKEGFEVIYGDTDSLFVKMKKEDKFRIQEVAKALLTKVNHYLKEYLKTKFKRQSYLELEFDKHFSKLYFPMTKDKESLSKKKYVGILEGELKFTGMEFVRSDSLELSKIFQYELFNEYFNDQNLEIFIKNFVKKLESGIFDSKLFYSKKITKDFHEYSKNLPPHMIAYRLLNYKGPYPLRRVEFIMTKAGPVPKALYNGEAIDYEHYKDKILRGISEGLLEKEGLSFDSIVSGDQLSLF